MGGILIRGGLVVDPSQDLEERADVLIENGRIVKVEPSISPTANCEVIDADGLVVSPGFVDLHAHLREPGQEWKESIETGCLCAVAGGITSVCCMANTEPVNDNPYITRFIVERAKEVGLCDVFPVGAITKGLAGKELAEIGLMVREGIVAISDDGNPVEDSRIMRSALEYAKFFNIPVFSHSEDKTLSEGGQVNEGLASSITGMPGIPPESEVIGVARDIILAISVGAKLHLCHVSTKMSLEIIRFFKEKGAKNITCEITPHHFTLSEESVLNFDTNFKVSPPLRSKEDVVACKEALADGTADAIATDHAPHSPDEKSLEFCKAPFGMIGFQTLLPLSLELVRKNYISLKELIDKISTTPARILGKKDIGTLKPGARGNVCIFDPEEEFILKEEELFSKSKNTPFLGKKLKGRVKITIFNGKIVFKDF